MKILNLYSGIGGNRKLWEGHEVTAVENDPDIAKIYQDFFPNDTVIVGDAHQYLLDHFKEFDFIWSSPPCPTHSRMNFLNNNRPDKKTNWKFPDMRLYEEIIFLKTWYKGKFCIENVISYYQPLIESIKSNNHYYWTNFNFESKEDKKRGIRSQDFDFRKEVTGFDLTKYNLSKSLEKKLQNNCVEPEMGLHILKASL